MPKSPEMSSSDTLAELQYLARNMTEEARGRLLEAVGTKFFGGALNHALFAGRLSSHEIQNWTALSKKEKDAVSDALQG